MDIEFIMNIEDFKRFCHENEAALMHATGDCKNCSQLIKCMYDKKHENIDKIIHMKAEETRFPWALRALKSNPYLADIVPAHVYRKLYGGYNATFRCEFCGKDLLEHMIEISEVYSMLTNEMSKRCFLNMLMYRLTFEREYLYRAVSAFPQYLIPAFQNHGKDEVYVDCGAFIGDSYLNYCRYNDYPKMAYLFEPDRQNMELMKQNMLLYEKETEFHYISNGVYHTTGKVYFTGGKRGQSHITDIQEKNSTELQVITIDDAVSDTISLIKMDIEGSEKAALIGASQHILECYPRLAICIYHGISDLWEIPLMIKDRFPKYNRFEIGQHDSSVFETVFYAYRV